jgi:hypothetical protein
MTTEPKKKAHVVLIPHKRTTPGLPKKTSTVAKVPLSFGPNRRTTPASVGIPGLPTTPDGKLKKKTSTAREVFAELVAKGVLPNTEEAFEAFREKMVAAYLAHLATKKPSTKRVKLTELDRLQAATGVKRQRPNYLAKGERRNG